MKTIFFFFALAASVAAIATQPEPRLQPAVGSRQWAVEPPVYYTGNNEPAASSVNNRQPSADSVQLATVAPYPLERAEEVVPECPAYLTGNDEPVPFGRFIAE
ncbi:MAG: hypothetical protein LBF55_00715 [Prevotellaceae bacterium]|jgi:hypothetical protein|nr:hypothetical protein [Prevotellaceae bacterium]